MKVLSIVVLLAGLLSACTSAPSLQAPGASRAAGQTQPAGPTLPATTGGAGGASLAEAAVAVTDACTLLPTDLAAKLIPGASAPQSQLFVPLKCNVSNQVAALEITIDRGSGAVEPIPGAEVIPGLGEAAYLERPIPDDAYLTVVLSKDLIAALHIEVAGHDGKDHKDDAIAVAQAVLAKLR